MSYKKYLKEFSSRVDPSFREDIVDRIAKIIEEMTSQDLEFGLEDNIANQIYDKVLKTIFRNLEIKGA